MRQTARNHSQFMNRSRQRVGVAYFGGFTKMCDLPLPTDNRCYFALADTIGELKAWDRSSSKSPQEFLVRIRFRRSNFSKR
jgi:hypothetical protein